MAIIYMYTLTVLIYTQHNIDWTLELTLKFVNLYLWTLYIGIICTANLNKLRVERTNKSNCVL